MEDLRENLTKKYGELLASDEIEDIIEITKNFWLEMFSLLANRGNDNNDIYV